MNSIPIAMNNRIVFLMLLIISVMTASCKDNNKRTEITRTENKGENSEKEYKITVSNGKDQAVNLSSLGNTISYIPLETNNRCLLSGNRFSIKFWGGSIFIRDSRALYQFSGSGKFIKQIGHNGSGPGEYDRVVNFTIVPDAKELFVRGGGLK